MHFASILFILWYGESTLERQKIGHLKSVYVLDNTFKSTTHDSICKENS